MFTSMGQAANYLCSEPELQELQIASETERAAWWATSQSPPSSHTRCWKTSPKILKPVNILALFNYKFPFQFFSCEIFGNVKISKLLPTKQILEAASTKIGPIPDLAFAVPSHDFSGWKSRKTLRVLWEQSSYVVLFWFAFLNPNSKTFWVPVCQHLRLWISSRGFASTQWIWIGLPSILSATFHPVTTKIRFWMFVCGGKISHIKYHNLWRHPTEVIKLVNYP